MTKLSSRIDFIIDLTERKTHRGKMTEIPVDLSFAKPMEGKFCALARNRPLSFPNLLNERKSVNIEDSHLTVNGNHPNMLAVLLAEKRHGAGRQRLVQIHHVGMHFAIRQNLLIH